MSLSLSPHFARALSLSLAFCISFPPSHSLQQAKVNLAQIDEDTDFLRDQTTTTEVNMARIYNYDVTERRKTGGK